MLLSQGISVHFFQKVDFLKGFENSAVENKFVKSMLFRGLYRKP